jgi:hypothetical protein
MTSRYSFEEFIIKCCKAKEFQLRKFLKSVLKSAGFKLFEDNYVSTRGGRYKQIPNLLAIRGESPRVCLVAHTDVCRDHAGQMQDVNPTVKKININGEVREIIQDKDCDIQVGGDDRLGVAINTWIALNTGYDISLLFTTDEEIGLLSAEHVRFPQLMEHDLLVQVDRGNRKDQIVNIIGNTQLCGQRTTDNLVKISEHIGLPRYTVQGLITDVYSIKTNGICKEAVNLTCGYYNSIGPQKDEYIDIQEANDTMTFVSNIIQFYYLEKDKEGFFEEDNSMAKENDYNINPDEDFKSDEPSTWEAIIQSMAEGYSEEEIVIDIFDEKIKNY